MHTPRHAATDTASHTARATVIPPQNQCSEK